MDKPLAIRGHWDYVDYESFVRGTDASELPPPQFEGWVPEAVRDEARKLYAESASQKDPVKAAELLSKLVSDPRMKSVWAELYKKHRVDHQSTEQFANPIYMTSASKAASLRQRASELRQKGGASNILEAEVKEFEVQLLETQTVDPLTLTPWTEQDLGVQLFFWQAYYAALATPKPTFFSKIKAEVAALRAAAKQLRAQAVKLQSHGIECAALQQIASEFDSRARSEDRNPKTDDPLIITRQVKDVRLRTFVATLSIVTQQLLQDTMYGTIATITNVVFSRADITGSKVRDMLRLPPGA